MQALLVTFLWSTSWVLIKFGIRSSLPAITFAGLRYSLAFLCLGPFVLFNRSHRTTLRNLSRKTWKQLVLLGIVFYALTQGAQFLSLALLPAATVSLLLNLTPMAVASFSVLTDNERPSLAQWISVFLSVAGAAIYFFPLQIPSGQLIGLFIAIIGLLANSCSALLGRRTNKTTTSPIIVTFVSMGIGAFILLLSGIIFQGFGHLTFVQWTIIGWLAVFNTAFAFWLWNNTLRTLTAVESSILNGTMLPQIALFAWILLDEPLSLKQISGMVLVASGALIVQLRRKQKQIKLPEPAKTVT